MKFSTDYRSKFTKQAQSGFTKILEQIIDYIRGGGLEPLPVNAHDQNGATLAKQKQKRNRIICHRFFTRGFVSATF